MRIDAQRAVMLTLLACILMYAALLRFDALFKSYGPYDHPGWLASLQPAVRSTAGALTPDWRWRHVDEPYVGGDPINYLKFAREMRSFYAAHVREPGFPGATRVALGLTGNAEVAVSLTSIAFALLTLVATFALGSAMGSPWAGLGAAAALAIDKSAVYWAVGGWRDEMFAFFAVMSAWAWLRLSQRGTYRRAVVAGVVSGGAILTRITSLSLLAPAVLFLLVRRDKPPHNDRHVAIAVALAAALAAPFLINCAIATGDPFYAINNHTDFYLKREGTPDPQPISAFQYALDKFGARPIAAADTVATGIFFYPFANKWVGLNDWVSGAGNALAVLAIAGLTAWLWSRDGRLLLLMLLSALIPFSVTWTVLGGAEWRLTFFVYAFELLAAFWLVDRGFRRRREWPALFHASALRRLAAVATIAAIFVMWTYAAPYAIARELLVNGSSAAIDVRERSRWLLVGEWSKPVVSGNVLARFSTESSVGFRVPLPEKRAYELIVRMDPLPTREALPQAIDVDLNGNKLGSVTLGWNPERVGEYRFLVPDTLVHPGPNRLGLQSHNMMPLGAGAQEFDELRDDLLVGFRLWYVYITPR